MTDAASSLARAIATTTAVAVAAIAAAACAFDVGFSGRLGPGLLPYLAAVGDVTHGRTPLVDTASSGGWGAIDAVSAILSHVALGYGPLALVVSGAAAVCALTMLALAVSAVRARGPAMAIGCAAVVAGTLAGPVSDSAAPSSGAMTLVIPLLGALAAVRGADRPRWRAVAVLCCFSGGLWSAPAAALTVIAVAAGVGGWPRAVRRGLRRRCAIAAAAGFLAYACVALVRSGALADPRVALAPSPLAASPGEPDPGVAAIVLGVATLLATGLAWWVSRRDPRDTPPRSASARRVLTALAAALAVHGLLAGAPVEIAHAAGLTLLLVGVVAQHRGARGAAAFAASCLVVCACAATTIAARWHSTALYAAIPHEPFDALHVGGGSFDQSLRYDLRVLTSRPEVYVDELRIARPLIGLATRRGDELLVLLPGEQQAELLATLDATSMLPTGDPTTHDIVGELRQRLLRAIDALPQRARLLTRADWLAASAGTDVVAEPQPAGVRALALVRERHRARVIRRRSGLVVAQLTRVP